MYKLSFQGKKEKIHLFPFIIKSQIVSFLSRGKKRKQKKMKTKRKKNEYKKNTF